MIPSALCRQNFLFSEYGSQGDSFFMTQVNPNTQEQSDKTLGFLRRAWGNSISKKNVLESGRFLNQNPCLLSADGGLDGVYPSPSHGR